MFFAFRFIVLSYAAVIGTAEFNPRSEAIINRVIKQVEAKQIADRKIKAHEGQEHTSTTVYEDPNDPAYKIGKELRCPVCQGMTIADSPVDMAQDMMRVVRKMLREGHTEEEIFAHFTRSYGDWILLRPRTHGVAWLVWLMPPLMVLLAGILFSLYLRGQNSKTPSKSSESADHHTDSTKTSGHDAYTQAIDDELI